MTLKERLEEKVRVYLMKKGVPVADGTICYSGIAKDFETPNGEIVPTHIVWYQTSGFQSTIFHRNIIHITVDNEKLFMLFTPHYFKYITDGEE